MTGMNLYRRLDRASRSFDRYLPWMWFSGLLALLVVSLLGLGDRWLFAVCLVTIYPAMVGWLGFNGALMLIKMTRKQSQLTESCGALAWSIWVAFLILGATFVAVAIRLTIAIVAHFFE
jgi:hypothetical protein